MHDGAFGIWQCLLENPLNKEQQQGFGEKFLNSDTLDDTVKFTVEP